MKDNIIDLMFTCKCKKKIVFIDNNLLAYPGCSALLCQNCFAPVKVLNLQDITNLDKQVTKLYEENDNLISKNNDLIKKNKDLKYKYEKLKIKSDDVASLCTLIYEDRKEIQTYATKLIKRKNRQKDIIKELNEKIQMLEQKESVLKIFSKTLDNRKISKLISKIELSYRFTNNEITKKWKKEIDLFLKTGELK